MSYKEAEQERARALAAYINESTPANKAWYERVDQQIKAFDKELKRATSGTGNYPK